MCVRKGREEGGGKWRKRKNSKVAKLVHARAGHLTFF